MTHSRTCVLILGMHRSGTSALAGALAQLGADLPIHLVGPDAGNPAGHWEPDALVSINNQMLGELGQPWYDWRKVDPTRLSKSRLSWYAEALRTSITDEYGDSALFVLKDPRISRLVPTYRDILGSLGVTTAFVISLRAPGAVVSSLVARDRMTPNLALLSWLRHILDAEYDTRGLRRVFVSYEALIADWRDVVTTVARVLGINWPNTVDEMGNRIDAFVTDDLQHHDATLPKPPEPLDVWVSSAYQAMRSLIKDPSDASSHAALDRIRKELEPGSELFGSAAGPELWSRDRTIAALAGDLASAAVDGQEKDRAYREVVASRSWLITAPLRSLRSWFR